MLDTNVVVSALIFGGEVPTALRHAWRTGLCTPLLSQPTAAELIRVLGYPKFRLTAAEQEELLADYLPFCASVRMPVRSPRTPVCRDPFDKPFLELAVVGKAQYLVTGDRDLQSLAPRFACPIITAAELVSALPAKRLLP